MFHTYVSSSSDIMTYDPADVIGLYTIGTMICVSLKEGGMVSLTCGTIDELKSTLTDIQQHWEDAKKNPEKKD